MDIVAEIVRSLEEDIARLAPGDRIPSEHDLMTRFGATRASVRRAIEVLESRFLVRRSQGAGTFVNRRIDLVLAPDRAPSLHEAVAASGSVARTFVIGTERRAAPEDIAARLGAAAGAELTRLTRLGYIDDDPATCGEEWLAPGALDVADLHLKTVESLTEVLRASGADPVRARSRVSTAFAPPEVAERFTARDPVPVWHIETLTTDGRGGRPLMFSRAWTRQDRVRVVVEYEPVP
ncbi:GntR family transcriptional regulator [Microbacterium sp. gxy059]|uniref:GntR family transcriptional regulator n=1 Tax=Microbacterium sp. gxy059 TaxID=2957199 RepID=UPI003D980E29